MDSLIRDIGNGPLMTWMMANPVIDFLNDTGIFMLFLMWVVTPYAIYNLCTSFMPKKYRDLLKKDIVKFMDDFTRTESE